MGMFDKDKTIGSQPLDVFGMREPFVLFEATIGDEDIQTAMGVARVTTLTGSRLTASGDIGPRMSATTFASAIREKVAEQEAGDLPAVVELQRVTSRKRGLQALVLRFIGPWPLEAQTHDEAAVAAPATAPAGKGAK